MGQFFNQPDFVTEAKAITANNAINSTTKLNNASLWVGAGAVNVIIAGTTGGQILTLQLDVAGLGYSIATAVDLSTTVRNDVTKGTVNITSVGGAGEITGLTINAEGVGYNVGDELMISGGTTTAVVTVASVDLTPVAAQAVIFNEITYGQYLPVIVDYVLATGTTSSNIVACH